MSNDKDGTAARAQARYLRGEHQGTGSVQTASIDAGSALPTPHDRRSQPDRPAPAQPRSCTTEAKWGVRPRHYAQERAARVLDEAIRSLRDGGDATATNDAIGTRMGIHEKHVRQARLGERAFTIGDLLLMRVPHALALIDALKAELLELSPSSTVPLSHRGLLATASGAEVGTAIVRAEADGVVTADEHAQIASVALRAAVGFSQLAAESRAASRFPRKPEGR